MEQCQSAPILVTNAGMMRSCSRSRKPRQTKKQIAKATGYSPSQVSRIICSPDFLELYGILFQEVAYGARANWLDRLRASG